MNYLLLIPLLALLIALLAIRELQCANTLLISDKKWAWEQVAERNNRLIVLSAKYDRLLGTSAEITHRKNELAKTVQNQAAELRRQHRRVVQ